MFRFDATTDIVMKVPDVRGQGRICPEENIRVNYLGQMSGRGDCLRFPLKCSGSRDEDGGRTFDPS